MTPEESTDHIPQYRYIAAGMAVLTSLFLVTTGYRYGGSTVAAANALAATVTSLLIVLLVGLTAALERGYKHYVSEPFPFELDRVEAAGIVVLIPAAFVYFNQWGLETRLQIWKTLVKGYMILFQYPDSAIRELDSITVEQLSAETVPEAVTMVPEVVGMAALLLSVPYTYGLALGIAGVLWLGVGVAYDAD